MQDLNDKVLGGSLAADEWNEVPGELQNVIEALGITLSPADLNQLGKAIAGYSANGDFYTDSGVADAYVLSVIGTKQAPPAYTTGFRIRFVAGSNNTGASTINVAALGVKDIKREDTSALRANDLVAGVQYELTYNGTDFVLVTTLYAPQGIYLGGTAAANLLDDYEKGTWTAGIEFGGASVGVTYSQNAGTYTKTGNSVRVNAYTVLTSKGTSTGVVFFTGLPFAVTTGDNNLTPISMWLSTISFADFPQAYAKPGLTTIGVEESTNAGAVTALTDTNFANNSVWMLSCVYPTSL